MQHDGIIDNAPGLAVRADIQAAIQALLSQNSGNTEPGTMYAGMVWFDTATGKVKMRNAANSAWVDLGTMIGSVGVANGGTGGNTAATGLAGLNGVSYGAAQSLSASQRAQARTNISAPLKGFLYGLGLSNNATDATNDIDIAAGEAASTETNPVLMTLASGITKRLDGAWAVGTGNGGLDTGTISNGTYHLWLIQRSDTGVVDVLFSASATAPTMPASYDRKRRIGSIIRESGAIVAFTQVGDTFRRPLAQDRSSTSAATNTGVALSVPAGIIVAPLVTVLVTSTTSTACAISLGSYATGSADTQILNLLVGGGDTSDRMIASPPPIFFTNTSRIIYFTQDNTTGTPAASVLTTIGWVDRRGQDGGL